jgi:SAM-dependent methyltransferase
VDNNAVKKIVKESYSKVAKTGSLCCCGNVKQENERIAKEIGYSKDELNLVPEANMGLGCGNPTALGEIGAGMVVLDLGSGAGFDCFLAAKKVGVTGKVIGVDMTKDMIKVANKNAKQYGFKNVEFRLGDIESLPVEDNSIDVVISNCVINLSPEKEKVFKEAYRVLRKGGRMLVSDIVLLKELADWQKKDKKLLAGCVGGAVLREKYIWLIKNAGFNVRIISEDRDISKRQYEGIPLESIKIEAKK